MTIDPIHKLHRQFQSVYWDHGRIQTVCLQNTNPNGHADTLWSPSIIPKMGSGWGRRNNIIRSSSSSIRDQISSDLIFFSRHRIGNKSKNQGVIGNWDKINFRKYSSRRKKRACTFIEREIKCGDKKWSKKEIANKDINKISFGQQGHAQTTAIRSNQKSTNIQSEGADVAICYIANHTNWSSKCMYAMKRGGFERESEFGDREYMELNTAENTWKHGTKRKTITEWICNPTCFVLYSIPRHTVFFCVIHSHFHSTKHSKCCRSCHICRVCKLFRRP